jgi:peptide/nickel transport system substrate-binding protein/oligopeptide transport system substrate-binding protein
VQAQLVQRDAPSVRAAARNGEVDMIVKDWWADYPDAENFLYPLLHSRSAGPGGNLSFWRNASYDSLVTRARRTTDATARADLYRQADALAFAEAPMVYLWFFNDLYAIQPWIQEFEVPTIFNGQRWTGVRFGGMGGGGR